MAHVMLECLKKEGQHLETVAFIYVHIRVEKYLEGDTAKYLE